MTQTGTTTRTRRTVTVTLPGAFEPTIATLVPFGELSDEVFVDGRLLGTISTFENGQASATPANIRRYGFFRFPSEAAAVAACLSYATRGYWMDEV